MKRTLLVLALTVLTAVLVTVVLAFGDSSSPKGGITQGGPLRLPPDGSIWTDGAPIQLGQKYSQGWLVLQNSASEPAVLERARLVTSRREIVLLGVFVLPVPNPEAIGFVRGFDPSKGSILNRTVVQPGSTVQVVLGLQLAKPGRFSFSAVRLRYRVGSRQFVEKYPTPTRLCAPVKRYLNTCTTPQVHLN